jgi:hypothetical protein
MNQTKQHKKLNKLNLKAELCIDRGTAQEIILKVNKVQNKFKQLP